MSTRGRPTRGFTMIELVLVLVVLTVLMAVAAPSLHGWNRGAKLRDAADDLISATRAARTGAIAAATVHRLELSPVDGTFRVTMRRGETFVAVDGDYGQTRRLPQGIRLDVLLADGQPATAIEFHPLGRATPATIRVSSEWGGWVDIECAAPAEPFRKAPAL